MTEGLYLGDDFRGNPEESMAENANASQSQKPPKIKKKLWDLDYEGLKKRLADFLKHRKNLMAKPVNGNPKKEKRRRDRLEDLDKRLIPQARKLRDVKIAEFKRNEVPFGD